MLVVTDKAVPRFRAVQVAQPAEATTTALGEAVAIHQRQEHQAVAVSIFTDGTHQGQASAVALAVALDQPELESYREDRCLQQEHEVPH
jgi:hypothetical protein